VPYSQGMVFSVNFDNDSDNTAYDVTTKLTLSSATFSPIVTTATEPDTVPGQSYTKSLVFTQTPPLHVPLKLTVDVEPVPGETDTANNKIVYYIELT
jgi:hypothetical protein